jgi:hypothetical protein
VEGEVEKAAPVTLAELEAELRSRRARAMVELVGDDVDVLLAHVGERGRTGKIASATAGTLEEAVELVLMRYDAKW